jgi:hypothetical protein
VTTDRLRGYGIPFDIWSCPITENGRTFREKIVAGALRLAGATISLNVDHQPRTAFAVSSNVGGTLQLLEDLYGVAFSVSLPADSRGDGVRFFVAGGRRCSVNLIVLGDTWGRDGSLLTRTIHSATVDHVAILSADAAYEGTGAWLQSEESGLPPYYRALAQRWGHKGSIGAPTASARRRHIIPESEMRIAARLAHVGRCV